MRRISILGVFLLFACLTVRAVEPLQSDSSTALINLQVHAGQSNGVIIRQHRLASYNIRCLTDADQGAKAWDVRKPFLARLIRDMHPDVIGLQEIRTGRQEAELRALLPEYTFVIFGRDSARVSAGEACGVAFLTDRYDTVATGHFFLTPDPKVPGKAWDAACPRIAVYVRLRDKVSGTTFAFCSTHLDHVGVRARIEGARVMSRELRKLNNKEPMIVVGDMNVPSLSKEGKQVINAFKPHLKDSYRLSQTTPVGPEGTWASWHVANAHNRIDYLFVKGLIVQTYTIVDEDYGREVTPSDHLPSFIDVAF